jgi:hypothetical protein
MERVPTGKLLQLIASVQLFHGHLLAADNASWVAALLLRDVSWCRILKALVHIAGELTVADKF